MDPLKTLNLWPPVLWPLTPVLWPLTPILLLTPCLTTLDPCSLITCFLTFDPFSDLWPPVFWPLTLFSDLWPPVFWPLTLFSDLWPSFLTFDPCSLTTRFLTLKPCSLTSDPQFFDLWPPVLWPLFPVGLFGQDMDRSAPPGGECRGAKCVVIWDWWRSGQNLHGKILSELHPSL